MFDPISAVSAAAGYAKSIGSKVIQLAGRMPVKPQLAVNREIPITPNLISCFVGDIKLGVTHIEGKGFKIPYILNRVIIKNQGRVPAEHCEAVVVKENWRDKLPWANGSGLTKILIPAQSSKELDFCAMLYLNPIEFNRINHTVFDTAKFESLVNEFSMPAIIFPSESGIQSPPSLNRSVKTGPYFIEVNNNGTEILKIPIVVKSRMDDVGIFVTLGT
jgi:hypothetical protein